METCGMSCVKLLVVLFNILLLLIGVGILVLGSLSMIVINEWGDAMGGANAGAAIVFIVLGVAVFTVAFLGCCGAWKEVKWMLGLYAVLLILIFVGQVAIFIAAFVMQGEVEGETNKAMAKLMVEASGDKEQTMELWDRMQKQFNCCGVWGAADWTANNTYFEPNVPKSCCKEPENTKTCIDAAPKNGVSMKSEINKTGCIKSIITELENGILYVGIAGVIFALLQIVGIIFACCLFSSVGKE